MANNIILRTRVTNLIHKRRVRWAGEDGVWFDRGGTVEFDGAFPSICRDDAARSALNEEWRRGMVKLVIRTNLSLQREKIPADVRKAWEYAEEHGETLIDAEKREKRLAETAARKKMAQREAAKNARRQRGASNEDLLETELQAITPDDGGPVLGEVEGLPSTADALEILGDVKPLK